jgi:hypothetical protein
VMVRPQSRVTMPLLLRKLNCAHYTTAHFGIIANAMMYFLRDDNVRLAGNIRPFIRHINEKIGHTKVCLGRLRLQFRNSANTSPTFHQQRLPLCCR